jgi:hypothetical protein
MVWLFSVPAALIDWPGRVPELKIVGDTDATFVYITSHLRYM